MAYPFFFLKKNPGGRLFFSVPSYFLFLLFFHSRFSLFFESSVFTTSLFKKTFLCFSVVLFLSSFLKKFLFFCSSVFSCPLQFDFFHCFFCLLEKKTLPFLLFLCSPSVFSFLYPFFFFRFLLCFSTSFFPYLMFFFSSFFFDRSPHVCRLAYFSTSRPAGRKTRSGP